MLIMPWMPQINSVLKPLGLLFNPRTYKGCDPSPPSVPCLPLSFQSTHPRGVRHQAQTTCLKSGMFQSTHPRGVRLGRLGRMLGNTQFQSTHPRGVRRFVVPRRISQFLFQSTHPRGVRQQPTKAKPEQPRFQSTHPRGVRRGIAGLVACRNGFNPRTHEGCDARWCLPLHHRPSFNPRTH